MKRNFRVFFDMDGVLACFPEVHDSLDEMYKEGFFANLKPTKFLKEVNKLAAIMPENIFILSACIANDYCEKEKIEWLKKYLPAAVKENVLFLKTNNSKAARFKQMFNKKPGKYDILVDDYSENIFDWEAHGGTAIKFKNKINNKTAKSYKYIIKSMSELMTTLEKIRFDLKD